MSDSGWETTPSACRDLWPACGPRRSNPGLRTPYLMRSKVRFSSWPKV
jgi:hypothetical protein